jgi:hypothetical protein
MSTTAGNASALPLISRRFESSRHQRQDLVAAFEHALPVLRRRLASRPAPRPATVAPCRQRRIVS